MHTNPLSTPPFPRVFHSSSFGRRIGDIKLRKAQGPRLGDQCWKRVGRARVTSVVDSRISLSQVWRHSCRTQTRYIARGCPLLDVIGQPLTSTTDGKFIGRWLPVLEPLSMVCKLAANEMSAGISRLNIFITVTVGCANYFLLTFEWKIILFLLIIPLILLLFLSRNYFRTTNLFHIIFPIFFMQRIFDNFIFIIGLGVIFFIDPLKLNAQDEGKRKVNRSRNKPGYRFSCNHINNGCFATIWCRRLANIDSVERSKQGGKIGKPVVFARGRREKSTRRGR